MTAALLSQAAQFAQAADDRRTGALVFAGGTVHLVDGQVTYAESAAAPGVGELLTASGRLAARTWQAAVDAGCGRVPAGRLLVEHGHLTQGELELCVLGATYDAAYFIFGATEAPVDFLDGARHWLGDVVRIDATSLEREARRRARLLDEILPNPAIDAAPVIPVARPPRARITVTAAQWELLVHADGQRTPGDLALLLGRAGFATVQELRKLAAAGLIEQPQDAPVRPQLTLCAPGPSSGPPTAPPPAPPSSPPPLDRRKPGARLPRDLAEAPPPPRHGADEALLKRLCAALRALR
ncbi:DUF4388 domain-containing protein [Actinoplanes sp. TFC3]|uniref:DUF4388 domain-containing protein n=1 Tax=Actinoplanes sp. TFC3 TaxID=1710355 RepID=UPI00082FAF89|nr:DUF4388 domain-containing protein [Actinoplanes sp. TFC3]